jgi:hypothetical protein
MAVSRHSQSASVKSPFDTNETPGPRPGAWGFCLFVGSAPLDRAARRRRQGTVLTIAMVSRTPIRVSRSDRRCDSAVGVLGLGSLRSLLSTVSGYVWHDAVLLTTVGECDQFS